MFHDIIAAFRFSVAVMREHLPGFVGLASIALSIDIGAEWYLGRFALLVQLIVTIFALRMVTKMVSKRLSKEEGMCSAPFLSWGNIVMLYGTLIAINIFFGLAGYVTVFLWESNVLIRVGALVFFGGIIAWFFMYYAWFSYFVVMKNVSPLHALRMSNDISKGKEQQNLLLLFSAILFNGAGLLCLGVGLLFTIPMTIIAYAYMFRLLTVKSG